MNLTKTIDKEKQRARDEERENNTEQFKIIAELEEKLARKEVSFLLK